MVEYDQLKKSWKKIFNYVANYKIQSKGIRCFEKKLLEKIDNEMFLYRPQIMKNSTNNLSKKNLRKNILGNYAIIYSKKFIERKIFSKYLAQLVLLVY